MAAGNDSSHTFTDLMTSLAVIFILLLVATLNNAFAEPDDAIKNLRDEVAEELKKINLTITEDPTDPYTQIINLDEDKVKFDFNKAALGAEGKELVSHLFEILIPKLCDENLRPKIESVIVEGHTDQIGNNTTDGKLGNLKLSQDRAYTVLHSAFTQITNVSTQEVECLRTLALATGRGSTQPKGDDSASRRVEIKIRVKSGISLQQIVKREAK